jgi:ribosomal protein S14
MEIQNVKRGKGHYHNREEATRLATEMLATLALTTDERKRTGANLSFSEAQKKLAEVIEHSGDTGDWLKTYATAIDITSDGSVIRWQDVAIGETSEDRSVFDSLWQIELIRTDRNSYQILKAEVSKSERNEFSRKVSDERSKVEEERRKEREKWDRLSQIEANRRAANRCQLCGQEISFWDNLFFQVSRNPGYVSANTPYLAHKGCRASLGGPINLNDSER